MSTVPEISTSTPPLIGNFNGQNLKLRRITVEEYDTMIRNGVFDEDEQVELLNGAILEKMPKGPKHATFNDIIATRFIQKLGDKVCVRNQNPIWLDEFSEPEPDIVLVEMPFEKYLDSHPTPAEIYLILEVSDSTLGYDRTIKYEAYARAGIRQYIVLNVQERLLEDYREPGADGFQSKQTYRTGQQFNLVAFPDILLSADEFLPVEKS
jgi:Uma2 family endonuclease